VSSRNTPWSSIIGSGFRPPDPARSQLARARHSSRSASATPSTQAYGRFSSSTLAAEIAPSDDARGVRGADAWLRASSAGRRLASLGRAMRAAVTRGLCAGTTTAAALRPLRADGISAAVFPAVTRFSRPTSPVPRTGVMRPWPSAACERSIGTVSTGPFPAFSSGPSGGAGSGGAFEAG